MFKDYSMFAEVNAKNDTINKQAYLHGELVGHLSMLHSKLNLTNIEQAYANCIKEVNSTFNHNRQVIPLEAELGCLRNSSKYYYNYHARHYSASVGIDMCEDVLPDLRNLNNRIINKVMLEIVKKEVFIDYLLNDTEEKRKASKIQDTVIKANHVLRNKLCNADLYHLKYTNAYDEESSPGFVHQVISQSDNAIKTKPEIGIDKDWCDNVFGNNLMLLEFEGARAFTISADVKSTDQDKTLYNVKVLQITGTRQEKNRANGYYYTKNYSVDEAIRKLFKVKDLVLSMSADKTHWALGTDEVKAERTMRRRQKLSMMKQLNL